MGMSVTLLLKKKKTEGKDEPTLSSKNPSSRSKARANNGKSDCPSASAAELSPNHLSIHLYSPDQLSLTSAPRSHVSAVISHSQAHPK